MTHRRPPVAGDTGENATQNNENQATNPISSQDTPPRVERVAYDPPTGDTEQGASRRTEAYQQQVPPSHPTASMPARSRYDRPPQGGHVQSMTGAQRPARPQNRPSHQTTGIQPPTGTTVQPTVKPPRERQRRVSQATGHVPVPRTRRPNPNHDSGFYLPLWSLGLMFLVVFLLAFGVAFMAVVLGGNPPVVQSTPIIRVITAPANQRPATTAISPPTLAGGSQTIIGGNASQNLALDGPTLPPVVFTPTPMPIQVNSMVIVDGVAEQQLNVRSSATIFGENLLFRADEDERFMITDGPTQADGFTWWYIQDPSDPNRAGWAVANYLQRTQEP